LYALKQSDETTIASSKTARLFRLNLQIRTLTTCRHPATLYSAKIKITMVY